MSVDDTQRLARIEALVRVLRDAERELHTLTDGQLDAVSCTGGEPLLLVEAQR